MDTTFQNDQVHANTIMCGEKTCELAVHKSERLKYVKVVY
jgi:hypothetical protein